MRGGFTFKLSRHWWRPAIQVRHLNARASLMQFTHPPERRDPRGHRKRNIPPRQRRGSFIDLKTIAVALFSRPFTLASLADFLKTPTRKAEGGGHGKLLTTKYMRYAVQDVQATWECYQALRDRFALHALEETPMGKIPSEASLGKAYLKQMGVRPFGEVQPDFPPHLTGLIMSTYFGGRAEVRWRREIRQVLYCDFLSMYPTVCTLMGLWRFVIAQGMEWRDSTEEIRALVNSISLVELQRPEFWPQLTTLVRVAPQADIFPARAKYDGKSQTIGLNYLSSENPLWFTLADIIDAKLHGGKSSEILEAITFLPKEPQTGRCGRAHLLWPERRGISRRVEEGRAAGAIFSPLACDPDYRCSPAHAGDCRIPLHRKRLGLGILRHRQPGDCEARQYGAIRVLPAGAIDLRLVFSPKPLR
jgi:hypothetical protein